MAMTADGIERLAQLRLPKLRAVTVCRSGSIDDAWLRALGSVPTLDVVVLERCSDFGPAGLDALLRSGITSLSLAGCAQVDDSFIPALIGHPRLRNLSVSGTGISDGGFAQLRERLPVCVVQAYPLRDE